MITIYSYCLRYDRGAAPNPFWGICTLVICKPKIRKAAQPGDWVVGFGSKNSPAGDLSERLVYMMEVTQKLTMRDYDAFARQNYPAKILDECNPDPRIKRGDSIYDFTCDPPNQRQGLHNESHRKTDLSGEYALLSTHFWYFGRNAVKVPYFMKNMMHFGRGHRSQSNAAWIDEFLNWIQNFELESNSLYGLPIGKSFDQANI